MSIGPGGGFKGMCPNIHTPVFSGSIDFASLKRIWDELKIIPPGCGDLIRAMSTTARLGHTTINENLLQNGQKSDDHLPPISTALVLYDPTLPHVSLKAHLENVTDKAIKSSFEIAKFESRHLSLEEGRLSFLAQNLRGRAVVSAAQSGRDDMIKELLQNGQKSEEHRGEAVVKAAQSGHVEVIDMLLQNGSIREEDRGQAVVSAAKIGRYDLEKMNIVEGLLQKKRDKARGCAVVSAAKIGRYDLEKMNIVEGLLQKNRDKARGCAVVSAARFGRDDIVEGLLESGSISEEDRGLAVIAAAQRGHVQVIDTLLRNGAQISVECRGWAVRWAVEYGYNDIIERLLQSGSISDEARGRAVVNAAEFGYVQVIDTLLRNGAQISVECRGQAVVSAAARGQLDVILTLLRNGAEISVEHQGRAVVAAAGRGNVQVIDTLLRNGAEISVEHRERAVVNAAQRGHVQVIDTLLRNGQIVNDENRGRAVVTAAGNRHYNLVEVLLQSGPINNDHRLNALRWAAQNYDVRMIMLLHGVRIPPDLLPGLGQLVLAVPREQVWRWAAGNGHLEVIDMLQNGDRMPLNHAVPPQPNNFRNGINVHAGSRDEKTRAALELLWERTNGLEIEEPYQSCISYLQGLPESDKKTLALKALFGPRIFSDNFPPLLHGNFSCNGFSLTGKELIGRLWGFISGCDGKNQDECKKGMLTALSTSFEGENLVCNQGKTQRLLIAVLQGRLKGVQIDDLAPVLTPDQVLDLFFKSDGRRGLIKKKEELLVEAENFLQLNPNVERASFMAKLEDYWMLRGDDEEEAVQGGAAQGGAAQGGVAQEE